MAYPKEIVSRSAYKQSIPIDGLKTEDFCVTRRIEGKLSEKTETFNGRAILDPDCLGNIVEMSVNLLGGVFLPAHTLWIQDGEGKKPWDGVTDVEIENYEGCYHEHTGDYVFYRASLLHNAIYPHDYELKSKEQYKAYHQTLGKKIEREFKAGETTRISVTLSLRSDPTFLNYWHFIVVMTLTGTSSELKNANSYRQLVYSHILNHLLCHEYQPEDLTCGEIPENLYLK